MSILEIQKALKAAGYDPGPLDGKDGPRTHAALMAFQRDRGLSSAPDQWSATESALRGGATAAPKDEWAQYQEQYPQFGWAFQDPEISQILRDAIKPENRWTPAVVQGKVMQTNWWKSKTDAERDWLQTLATNPAQATRELNNYDSITKFMQQSSAFGIPMDFETAARQVDRVVRGEIAPDALTQELRIQAKALYPQLAQQIDAGATVDDVFAPYKQLAAQVLGVNPESISLTDPQWQAPLQYVDGGVRRLATTDEWMRQLKTDSRFGYDRTSAGRSEAAQLATALAEKFGVMG